MQKKQIRISSNFAVVSSITVNLFFGNRAIFIFAFPFYRNVIGTFAIYLWQWLKIADDINEDKGRDNDDDSYNNDDIHDAEENNHKRLVVGMMQLW